MISGFRVSWDSRKPAGQRVLGVWSLGDDDDLSNKGASEPEEVSRTEGGRKYTVVTREYMAQGHDGFSALQGHRYLVNDEEGQLMSAIVRKYLLVSDGEDKGSNPDSLSMNAGSTVCQ